MIKTAVKLTGALMLGTGSVILGICKARELSENVAVLMGIEEAMLAMESEMQYRAPVISECFEKAQAYDRSGIFERALKRGGNPEDGLKEAVVKSSLSDNAKSALLSFADGLCCCEKEGQIQNIRLCRARIGDVLRAAKAEKEKMYKLYIFLGGSCAAAFIALFI